MGRHFSYLVGESSVPVAHLAAQEQGPPGKLWLGRKSSQRSQRQPIAQFLSVGVQGCFSPHLPTHVPGTDPQLIAERPLVKLGGFQWEAVLSKLGAARRVSAQG